MAPLTAPRFKTVLPGDPPFVTNETCRVPRTVCGSASTLLSAAGFRLAVERYGLFEVEMSEAAGTSVEAVVGEPLPALRTSDLLALDTLVGLREFEPRASVVTGAGGDGVGFSVVLRDVTERRTREERLQVRNRVLRHDLRNEVSVISGYAELLVETGATVALDRAATEITETAYDLAEIGEKARSIEQMMAEQPNGSEPLAVADAVERAVEPVADSYPDCDIAVDVTEGLEVAANVNVLVPVLENVVENAAQHNDRPDPHVDDRASEGVDQSTVTLTVVDDGPGIPEEERVVLESGNVTPLEHGSGLGLWVAKWGVTRLGGELSFSATEPRGTIVTIRLPVEGPELDAIEATTPGLAT
jgi:signal transduction histidine kinase